METNSETINTGALGSNTPVNISDQIKSILELNDESIGESTITDLGKEMTPHSKLTLKNLGKHLTDRMLKSMSKDKINYLAPGILGTPGNMTDVYKLFQNFIKNDKNKTTIQNLYNAEDYKGEDKEEYKISGTNIESYTLEKFGEYYKYLYGRGLRIGEASVINPDFQFNEIDDVRSDFRTMMLGRLYSERIYSYNLPIAYFQPGTITIDTNAILNLNNLINLKAFKMNGFLKGSENGIKLSGMKMGNMFANAVAKASKMVMDHKQWYHWIPECRKYMYFTNEFLIELATWMGLINNEQFAEMWTGNNSADSAKKYQEMAEANQYDKLEKQLEKTQETKGSSGMTEDGFFVVDGYLGSSDTPGKGTISVAEILPQFKIRRGEDYLKKLTPGEIDDNTGPKNEKDLAGMALAELTVPIALNKGVTITETFSNTTIQHPLSSEYNRQFEESNNASMMKHFNALSTAKGGLSEAASSVFSGESETLGNALAGAAVGSVTGGVKDWLNATLGGFTNGIGEIGMVANGAGRFVLPEVWTDSTFDRSYNISLKFKSPYGHRLSIFENTLIPLGFLIGMTAPRQIGFSSYTNPFYIKAFSKGLFSCEMGMITSLSITHGEDKGDRTYEGFFKSINVSISIKDMLPSLAIGLDAGIGIGYKSANTSMSNYICSIAGIDFIERMKFRTNISQMMEKYMTEFNEGYISTKSYLSNSTSVGKLCHTVTRAFGDPPDPTKLGTDYKKVIY